MSILGWLFGGSGAKDRLRHKGRWGPKGAYRKVRNGDGLPRGSNGRYGKKR
jgi:hypothetical protein